MKSFVLVLLIVSSPKQTSRGEERSPSQSQTNRVLYFLSPTPIMTNTWKRAGRAKSSQPQWLFLGNKWWLIDFCTPNQMWFKWNDRLQGCMEENLQQAHALPGSSKAETLTRCLTGRYLFWSSACQWRTRTSSCCYQLALTALVWPPEPRH